MQLMLQKAMHFCMRAFLLLTIMCFWPLVIYMGMMVLGLSCEFVVTVVAVTAVAISVAAETTVDETCDQSPEKSDGLDALGVAEDMVQTEGGTRGVTSARGACDALGKASEVGKYPASPDSSIVLTNYNLRERKVGQFR
jgi:hypothetical protein